MIGTTRPGSSTPMWVCTPQIASCRPQRPGEPHPQWVKVVGSTDISRNHARVEVSAGLVLVTDLHSRNGTDIVLPDRSPERLRPGEPTVVVPGTVIDLGSGVAFTVRS